MPVTEEVQEEVRVYIVCGVCRYSVDPGCTEVPSIPTNSNKVANYSKRALEQSLCVALFLMNGMELYILQSITVSKVFITLCTPN